jgi:hypothetical protein
LLSKFDKIRRESQKKIGCSGTRAGECAPGELARRLFLIFEKAGGRQLPVLCGPMDRLAIIDAGQKEEVKIGDIQHIVKLIFAQSQIAQKFA